MIEIYLLEQLAAFARCGTLLRAAEKLHISQPALSRSMKKLEEQFGVPLFDRKNSRISLNATGRLAAEYAEKILDTDREMIEKVISFDRNLRTISIGGCTPLPVSELIPALQEYFIGMAITSEIAEDDRLLTGLRNHLYQLVILHEPVTDPDLYCHRYLSEQIYISLPVGHPLAEKSSVTFADLRDIRILVYDSIGFWMRICREHLAPSNLLVQSSRDTMDSLVEASSLPVFSSDQTLLRGYRVPGRVFLPITDARTTYYIACLASEAKKYSSVFGAIDTMVTRNELLKKELSF